MLELDLDFLQHSKKYLFFLFSKLDMTFTSSMIHFLFVLICQISRTGPGTVDANMLWLQHNSFFLECF